MVSRAVKNAQTQVESQNFEIRKDVLKYDEVMNQQRTVIYKERKKILEGEDITDQVESMIYQVVSAYVDGATAEGYVEDWDLDKLWEALGQLYPVSITAEEIIDATSTAPPIDLNLRTVLDDVFARTTSARPRSRVGGEARCVSSSADHAAGLDPQVASTSTRWTTSRRASACGRWPATTRGYRAGAATCSRR